MAASRALLGFCACCACALATDVFVMLPLDAVTDDGKLKDPSTLSSQLDQLKAANVAGVTTDVWWGITEPTAKQYSFAAYEQLVGLVKEKGMKLKLMASFHQCGGNVGDTCNIPIPAFVRNTAGIWYKDKDGNEDKEYVSLFADNVEIAGRTPLQMYHDWLAAFAKTFSEDLGKTIAGVQLGMGPAGELRYPAYPLSHWKFCGIGAFQSFDQHAVGNFTAAAKAAGHSEWNSPPTDAGDYNSRPDQTSFFGGGYSSDYGKFFLDWYFGALKAHGGAVLDIARAVLGDDITLAGKVAGIHWWYKSAQHAAELTAGYYNANTRDAYAELAAVFSKHKTDMDFTCLEMKDSEQDQSCASGPEELVNQVANAAKSNSIAFNGENALPRFDNDAYGKIESYKNGLKDFTYLRLDSQLLNGDNFNKFKNFVNNMRAGSVIV